jgi:ribosomal protein S27E
MTFLTSVNRYTRAGNQGKDIICPHCSSVHTVYHFAWSAIVCEHCQQEVEKQSFLTTSTK